MPRTGRRRHTSNRNQHQRTTVTMGQRLGAIERTQQRILDWCKDNNNGGDYNNSTIHYANWRQRLHPYKQLDVQMQQQQQDNSSSTNVMAEQAVVHKDEHDVYDQCAVIDNNNNNNSKAPPPPMASSDVRCIRLACQLAHGSPTVLVTGFNWCVCGNYIS